MLCRILFAQKLVKSGLNMSWLFCGPLTKAGKIREIWTQNFFHQWELWEPGVEWLRTIFILSKLILRERDDFDIEW